MSDISVGVRMEAMERFFDDYEEGKQTGRYINASLPELPFEDNTFDLALCSHYLFLYSEHVNLEEHILSVKELCRVANEVRVYPLVTLEGKPSGHLDSVAADLQNVGMDVSFHRVRYRFQNETEEMLVAK